MFRAAGAFALVGALALWGSGCAAESAPGRTVLAAEPDELERGASDPGVAPDGPVAIPFHPPPSGGIAYRLLLEYSGERLVQVSTELEDPPLLGESHLLELEYLELPVEGREGSERSDAYLLSLDGLHYRLRQTHPKAEREIELAADRLRFLREDKVSLDLKGAQPKEDLTPRSLLQRVFAVVVHDGHGNPSSLMPRGVPSARRFLAGLPVRQAIAYTRVPLPAAEVTAGATWHGIRFPVSPAGELGLGLEVSYTLAGFARLDGVPCAWIVLRAAKRGDEVPSAAGFAFDRVVAELTGEAWVELETSLLRRLVLEDEVRVAYTRGEGTQAVFHHRLRHRSRLVLELRDRDAEAPEWADGSERFGTR